MTQIDEPNLDRECYCACHNTKPPANTDGLRHDNVCCEEMNGQLEWFRLKELLATRNKQLHQALLSGLPERKTKTSKAETDWRYRKAQVYSQFDMDLEFDEALDQATRLINKVFNKEQ